MLVEFSLKLVYATLCWKKFKFMMFTFLENALNLGVFTHAPLLPTQNSPQVVIITP